MLNDLRGKAVLITGGTMGIGLATGLAFGRQGARCILTYKWGTADAAAVLQAFDAAGAPAPQLVQADVGEDEDTRAVLAAVAREHSRIEAFVSNVSVSLLVRSVSDYKKRSLFKSIENSAWPLFAYPQAMKETFGHYPRYVVGVSSAGPDDYVNNYDFVAASKAVMETLCRYLAYRLFDEDVRVNVVRPGTVVTESMRATIGRDYETFLARLGLDHLTVPTEQVADAILALCSGLLDGVSGQVILVDRGTTFFDNNRFLFERRDALGL